MKPIAFLGDALRTIRAFPEDARRAAGAELRRVQLGEEPKNWKPFATIGPGVCEIRVRDGGGAFRVIYLARLPDAVYVLHAFQKKAMKTPARDIDVAKARLAELRRRGKA
jgi:phage-related protein